VFGPLASSTQTIGSATVGMPNYTQWASPMVISGDAFLRLRAARRRGMFLSWQWIVVLIIVLVCLAITGRDINRRPM
jgi:hypothetical protein